MKKRKRVGLIVAACIFSIILSGCGNGKSVSQGKKQELPQIVVGSDNYPPFNYTSEEGTPTGIDVDLATEAFHRMGYEAKFELIDWENKKTLVDDGDIDCVWGSFSIDGREKEYKWAGPYMVSSQVVAVEKNSGIYTLQDLKDKNIAVQATTKPEEIFLNHKDKRIQEIRNLFSMQDRELIYPALSKGYVDAIAAHETAIRQYMKDYDTEYRILEEPLLTVGLGVAFSLKDDRGLDKELTQTLKKMQTDGTTKKIISKYLEDADKYLEVGDEGE